MRTLLFVLALAVAAPVLAQEPDVVETQVAASLHVHHLELTDTAGSCVAIVCADVKIKETGATKDLGCRTGTFDDATQKTGCFNMMKGAGLSHWKKLGKAKPKKP